MVVKDSGMAQLLVVDDEDDIRYLLRVGLEHAGYRVRVAASGREALTAVEEQAPDLAVLDVMMPDLDGFEICRRWRSEGLRMPVLFLTARDAMEDTVHGLAIGGDDYVTKPFSLEELTARVRAALRRAGFQTSSQIVGSADLVMDDEAHVVTRGDKRVDLSPTEYKLLRFLLINRGTVLSKEQILDYVWEYDFDGPTNNVETFVSYLRRKLDDGGPSLIETVRGFGYVIRPS